MRLRVRPRDTCVLGCLASRHARVHCGVPTPPPSAQAGGKATTGTSRSMELQPTTIHGRQAVVEQQGLSEPKAEQPSGVQAEDRQQPCCMHSLRLHRWKHLRAGALDAWLARPVHLTCARPSPTPPLHFRAPIYLGSKEEVEEIERCRGLRRERGRRWGWNAESWSSLH